jgi:hypothetical protein
MHARSRRRIPSTAVDERTDPGDDGAKASSPTTLAATAGVLAIVFAVAIGISLRIRDVNLNVLNVWTLAAAAVAGLIVLTRSSAAAKGAALVLLLLAALPAMFGWVGWLLVPPIGLLLADVVGDRWRSARSGVDATFTLLRRSEGGEQPPAR